MGAKESRFPRAREEQGKLGATIGRRSPAHFPAPSMPRVPEDHAFAPSLKDIRARYPDNTFLVQVKGFSALHLRRVSADFIAGASPGGATAVARYAGPTAPEETLAEAVIRLAHVERLLAASGTEYFVKWRGQPYSRCTWESMADLQAHLGEKALQSKIDEFIHCNSVTPVTPAATSSQRGFSAITESPEYAHGGTLHPWQVDGLNWLLFNWFQGHGSILADEMGLGKTLQSVATLDHLAKNSGQGPFLVLAPVSTLVHWKREFDKWTSLNSVVYHGSKADRQVCRVYEWKRWDAKGNELPGHKFDVLLCSYETCLSDLSEIGAVSWSALVVDEAQRLKNWTSKLSVAVRASLRYKHTILLTGTPIQNSLDELWALLHLCSPRAFPETGRAAFLGAPVAEVHELIAPFLLRRLKAEVALSIPGKEETLIECELTLIQKQYYRAVLERNRAFLAGSSPGDTPHLINIAMQLRKVCNHPYLLAGVEAKVLAEAGPDSSPLDLLVASSGKLVLVDKLLPKLRAGGHKVLVFSQFKLVLDLLEDYLRLRGYSYERLDGDTGSTARQHAIDRFSGDHDGSAFVFLLSTRAGGTGINLAAADTVIIFDSDWNPQNDVQAQARAHRLGQTAPVKVYRLITSNTYEKQMFVKSSLKLGLGQAVLGNVGETRLSGSEINSLLRNGAYDLLSDAGDEQSKLFCDADIDSILSERATVLTDATTDSGFNKATFLASGADAEVDVTAEDFWETVLPDSDSVAFLSRYLRELTPFTPPPTATPSNLDATGEISTANSEHATRVSGVATYDHSTATAEFHEAVANVLERVGSRVAGVAEDVDPRESVVALLEEMVSLPLEPEARAKVEAWKTGLETRSVRKRSSVSMVDDAGDEEETDRPKKKSRSADNTPEGLVGRLNGVSEHNWRQRLRDAVLSIASTGRADPTTLSDMLFLTEQYDLCGPGNVTGLDCARVRDFAVAVTSTLVESARSPGQKDLFMPASQAVEALTAPESEEGAPLTRPMTRVVTLSPEWSNAHVAKSVKKWSRVFRLGRRVSEVMNPDTQLAISPEGSSLPDWWSLDLDHALLAGVMRFGTHARALDMLQALPEFSALIPVRAGLVKDPSESEYAPGQCLCELELVEPDMVQCVFCARRGHRGCLGLSKTNEVLEYICTGCKEPWPEAKVLEARVRVLLDVLAKAQAVKEDPVPSTVEQDSWSKREKKQVHKSFHLYGPWQAARVAEDLEGRSLEDVEAHLLGFVSQCMYMARTGWIPGACVEEDWPVASEAGPQLGSTACGVCRHAAGAGLEGMVRCGTCKVWMHRGCVFWTGDIDGYACETCTEAPCTLTDVPVRPPTVHPLAPAYKQALERISVPMEVGNVTHNLEKDAYPTISDYAEDMRALIRNAYPTVANVSPPTVTNLSSPSHATLAPVGNLSLPSQSVSPRRAVEINQVFERQFRGVLGKFQRPAIVDRYVSSRMAVRAIEKLQLCAMLYRAVSGRSATSLLEDLAGVPVPEYPDWTSGCDLVLLLGVSKHGFGAVDLILADSEVTGHVSAAQLEALQSLLEDRPPLYSRLKCVLEYLTTFSTAMDTDPATPYHRDLLALADSIDFELTASTPASKPTTKSARSGSTVVTRDDSGAVIFPVLARGGATVHSLGRIVTDRPSYHNKTYIYPVGYKCTRFQASWKTDTERMQYTCEILDDGKAPVFRVTPDDDPDHPVSAATASAAWVAAFKLVDERKNTQRLTKVTASGPEMFGLGDPEIKKLIEELDGAEECVRYLPVAARPQ